MVVATDGMVVTTESDKVIEARKVVVGLLLASGEHDLSDPDQTELAQVAHRLGITGSPYPKLELEHTLDTSHPLVAYDESKCIRCFRCTRACNSTVVNEVLDMAYRGLESRVITDADVPWGESTCVACGECIQVCPTGALFDKRTLDKTKPDKTKPVTTVCAYCGVGCRVDLHVDESNNRIARVTGAEDGPANEGMLCVKGRFGFDFVASPERLTTPQIRNSDGTFRPASWAEAVPLVARRLREVRDTHGGDSIAGLSSAKCTNEENYLFQKFMRKEVGTNNVDHCARL
jgi:predicted molibdopterin-dependent oxidoreductase YjgC